MPGLPKLRPKLRAIPKPVQVQPPPAEPELSDDDDDLAFPLYDLRNSGGVHDSLEANAGIVQMLDDLINHTIRIKASSTGRDKANHQRRINSFIKGRDAIKDYTIQITSGAQAQKQIEGVGPGIAKRIQEFLTSGKLAELEEIVSAEAKLIMELCDITGIGEVKAKSLITDYKVTSVDDLITKYRSGEIKVAKNQLTHHIAVGLEYYYDLKQRMTWKEADQIAFSIIQVLQEFDPELIVQVCGSYRRHKPTCGDLDVLVTHSEHGEESSPLPDIVSALEKSGILTGHLTTKGKTKYMGVCKGASGIGRRIDIRFVEHGSLGAAMLYFTGSGKFNKIMRYHANTRGFTLNEYGLYTYVNGVKGDSPIPAKTEQDIFKILGFVYLKPVEREF
jgi:DNA polymerase lambda